MKIRLFLFFALIAGALTLPSTYGDESRVNPGMRLETQMRWRGHNAFILGSNLPWYNGYRGLDLAPLRGTLPISTVAIWKGQDKQNPGESILPGQCGFNAAGIEVQFADMEQIGLHAVRWFIGNDARSFIELDQAGNCQGIDPAGLQNLDEVMRIAQRHHIFLIPCLFDFRFVSGDTHVRYADGRSGESHASIIRNAAQRQLLIKNFVVPLSYHYANCPQILCWEIMNECANVVAGIDPATGFSITKPDAERTLSPVEMQTFLNECYVAMKSVDPNHAIMPSGLARPHQLPLLVGRVHADLYGAHYNDNGIDDYGKVMSVREIEIQFLSPYGKRLDHPLLMTESSAGLKGHLDYYVQSAFSGGWAGILPWSYYGIIGYNDLKRYDRLVTSQDARNVDTVRFLKQFNASHSDETNLEK